MRTFPDALSFCIAAATSALTGRRYLSCLWELTYRCTARCGICNYWRRKDQPDRELSLPEIQRGLDRVFAHGCRLVNFTGGEPTLRVDLENIVAHASRLGMWVSMVTNGSGLTRDRVRRLRKAGLDNLLVSLDSASPAEHDEQRGVVGSFQRVEECVHWIRDEFLRGHRTGGVMCVITRRNRYQLTDVIEFARERGVFVLFQPYHANKTGDADPAPDAGPSLVRELTSQAGGHRVVLNTRSYLRGFGRPLNAADRPPCHAGHKYFSVDPYGRLHPCVDMPAVGSILSDEITVVRSRAAQEMVANCQGCWYCFRGESDTALTAAGCLEKAWLGLAVVRHNAARKLRRSSGGERNIAARSQQEQDSEPRLRRSGSRP
jgi:MoaA/NifB/PqqE/SkfB family radical SAM enzyme